ncbi:MAG: 4-alpha-glucanotransferase, partial [Acidimicrobiales bacterium]|nr:4-alpha-glucanotransferase [Acidimicrobiales bacterium]
MTERTDPATWGVAEGFHDVGGRWHPVSAPTLAAVLESLGAQPGDPPPPALVTVRTDHLLPSLGRGRVVFEDGGELDIEGDRPASLPLGYHRFQPADGADLPLVVSPGRAPLPAVPSWGFATQLYATRSKRSWGIGDLADLAELGRWSATVGAGFTLVNPLHAPTPGPQQEPSPYFPGSRCFMNPLYIAVESVPAVEDLEDQAAMSRALNGDRRIDRDAVWAAKSAALEGAFERFSGDADFERYVAARGRPLHLYAAFCALAERHGSSWREWPYEYRHPSRAGVDRVIVSGRVRYHMWLQWLLDCQICDAANELGIVVDLAVGVDPSGPDSWIWQDVYAPGMGVGAPPDEFNTRGQDWGLPPFNPWLLRAAAYEPWIEALRANLAHGQGLRVDHVMGLFRLYWIPGGADAGSGAYVRYPHHDMLNILALEAHRAGAWVVGEDLGTVEDEVRWDLA